MKSLKPFLPLLFFIFLLIGCRQSTHRQLILATTTSTEDSGLLDQILLDFEAEYEANIEVIAVGTGQALALGKAGDADILLVHAPEQEAQFVADGYGTARYEVMYNDFVIVGDVGNPAGIAGNDSVTSALQQIAQQEALFISRGDNSGTHIREQSLWENAGIQPSGDWYQSIGQGMGATLTLADEQGGYTLTDRGTFIARQAEGIGLLILVEGDKQLHNQYGVIVVNPAVYPDVNSELALDFIQWLLSPATQQKIGDYRINGQQLFMPNANPNQIVDTQLEQSRRTPFMASLVKALSLIGGGNREVWQICRDVVIG